VPPEYLTRQVWARWDGRTVHVFNHESEQIACHLRQESGRFSKNDRHIPRQKRSGVERAATAILDRFPESAELITITGKSYRLRNRSDAKADGGDSVTGNDPTTGKKQGKHKPCDDQAA
jgi:hypothetical protein